MTYPRINTITTEYHTGNALRLRFVLIDETPYLLARDVGSAMGLTPDKDGDYRSTLRRLRIDYIDAVVADHNGPIGSHALISEQEQKQLVKKAAATAAEASALKADGCSTSRTAVR